PSSRQEPWCLQSLPCTALPQGIPRCCACAPRATGDPQGKEEEEEPPESTCRLLHFRRFALGDNGELSVDGLCTLGEAEGELLEESGPEPGGRNVGSSLCLAKYLLGVLGDPFCDAVRRDRDMWPGAPGGPEEGPAQPPECTPGRDHPVTALVPTQFVPTCVLTRLWKLLHEVRAKFGIESRCPCGRGAAEQSPAEPPGRQEPPGAAVPTLPPPSRGQADPSRPIKEESPELGPPSPGQPPARGAVQTTTLCDLLASTAVKLCLGQDGVRMAFAPVVPTLPSDNRLTSILDSIIARVVERKIQERQAGGGELSPPSPSEPPASHCVLEPSGLLWLHDPGHASNYKLFQEHWRQGQPVLVSGLQKRLEGRLWGPESFRPARGEQEVEAVNLRAPASRVRLSSWQFWDGFATSAASPEREHGGGDLLKLESGLGDMELSRVTNLRASLPLPEYCGASGRLNLATHLRGQRGRHWLRPRVCAAYGVRPRDQNVGTKNLAVEAADSINVLVHTEAAPREALLPGDVGDMDVALRERLKDTTGARPGALWHIFRAEDALQIRDFLRRVSEELGQEEGRTGEPPGCSLDPPGRYLDAGMRRRLREECGVSGWTLLQCLGDAVLVPAGAPHQVQSLTGTISVEQRFLSPESCARLRQLSPDPDPTGATRQLPAQLDGMIFSAVREALGVLRGCK
ncbi:lysine-specific demethylase hairless-like, partial [Empidonax traillii]|uniref:lysine-specific demethylase hairless-like n=1 Tax=Empidonax traillii TaxID=164674 RepID=UPI000FFD2D4C